MSVVPVRRVNPVLTERHYLGPIGRGIGWEDEFGVMVLTTPTSRMLNRPDVLEVARWCLNGTRNGGSRQWSRVAKWLRRYRSDVGAVVSYSDPAHGHDGALYRACNWQWRPTWHRLREPPTGNGDWGSGKRQAAKDRWVFFLGDDPELSALFAVKDASIERHGIPSYREFVRGKA